MLNISIVLYHPKWEQEVLPLVEELLKVKNLQKIYLLDNSEVSYSEAVSQCNGPTALAVLQQSGQQKLRYIYNGANLGYGRAHNIALRESAHQEVAFHLVMNSDIRMQAEDIDAMHDFMVAHPPVGQMMPRVVNLNGTQQYLAKRLPTPLDVFGRRFLPACWMEKRNRRFELRDHDLMRPLNAPYLSGCFMMLRTKAAVEAGLFDERYFMYPEDIDLTRTIHRNWLTLYNPQWTITHAHARGSYKNIHMLRIHIQNMCRYFNKWGWLFDSERQTFNNL